MIDSTASCWVNCSGDNVVFAECHSVWAVKAGMDPATRQMSNSKESFSFFLNGSNVQPLINIALFSHLGLKYAILSLFSTLWYPITTTQLKQKLILQPHTHYIFHSSTSEHFVFLNRLENHSAKSRYHFTLKPSPQECRFYFIHFIITVMTVQNYFLTMVFLMFGHLVHSVNLYFLYHKNMSLEEASRAMAILQALLFLSQHLLTAHIYFHSFKSDPEDNYLKKNIIWWTGTEQA